MTNRQKLHTTLIALLATGFVASAANASTSRDAARVDSYIQPCILEIAKQADYGEARKVVHRVARLDQRNLVEMEIKVITSVHTGPDEGVAREYRTTCRVAGLGDLVKFNMNDVPTTNQ